MQRSAEFVFFKYVTTVKAMTFSCVTVWACVKLVKRAKTIVFDRLYY